MLEQTKKVRYNIIIVITYIVGFILLFQLFNLQVIKGSEYRETSNTRLTRESTVKAARGNITDNSGNKLVTTKTGFSLELYKTKIDNDVFNNSIYNLVVLLEKNKDTYNDNLPITVNPYAFTAKDEETQKMTLSLGGNMTKDKSSFVPSISNENSTTKTYEYKELQEIKETNSTYLSEIIKKCKRIDDKKLTNGSLIKIDDVQLQIVNRDEIAQINSMLSGIFKDSNISTVSDGQTLNIDINAIGNILLKDYKYSLKGKIKNTEFYISIPIKTEKEFENDKEEDRLPKMLQEEKEKKVEKTAKRRNRSKGNHFK